MEPKFDVLCFGSVTLDIFISPDEKEVAIRDNAFVIPLGDKIKAEHVFQSCGGSAANTGIGFAKMGFHTGAVGFVGDDEAAHYITSVLKKNNVDIHYLEKSKHEFSSFSVILNAKNGHRTVIHHRNSQEDFDPRHLLNSNSKALYIGHLYGKSEDMLDAIPQWKTAHPDGIIGWNPGKTQFKKGIKTFSKILPLIDAIIINKEEAEDFTSQKGVTSSAQKLLSLGAKRVFITDGGNGAWGFEGQRKEFQAARNKNIVSTLGAGDAFSVGVVTALLKKKDLSTQLLWGSRNAQSVIQKWGAQEGQLSFSQIQDK